jgi:hypothetical protein
MLLRWPYKPFTPFRYSSENEMVYRTVRVAAGGSTPGCGSKENAAKRSDAALASAAMVQQPHVNGCHWSTFSHMLTCSSERCPAAQQLHAASAPQDHMTAPAACWG